MQGSHASRTEVRKRGDRQQRRGNLAGDEGWERSRQAGPGVTREASLRVIRLRSL